jgi:hypothetical protein
MTDGTIETGAAAAEAVGVGERNGDERMLELELTLPEAEALKSWVAKPGSDGSSAMDDPAANGALAKLMRAIDHARSIDVVREALEGAGLPTARLSDAEILVLRERIAKAPSANAS